MLECPERFSGVEIANNVYNTAAISHSSGLVVVYIHVRKVLMFFGTYSIARWVSIGVLKVLKSYLYTHFTLRYIYILLYVLLQDSST